VDVRTIAASNQNLATLRAEGRFRDDLYYRLNVMEIVIPPLRDRREDIRPLAEHFLEKHVRQAGKTIRGFAPEAQKQLLAYGFPGNVRELENIIERAVILEKTDLVRPESLPQSIALFQVETFSPKPHQDARGTGSRVRRESPGPCGAQQVAGGGAARDLTHQPLAHPET